MLRIIWGKPGKVRVFWKVQLIDTVVCILKIWWVHEKFWFRFISGDQLYRNGLLQENIYRCFSNEPSSFTTFVMSQTIVPKTYRASTPVFLISGIFCLIKQLVVARRLYSDSLHRTLPMQDFFWNLCFYLHQNSMNRYNCNDNEQISRERWAFQLLLLHKERG